MRRRATASGVKAFTSSKPKKNFVSKLTGFFKPLTNLFGGSNVLSSETKPLRDIIDIKTKNRNRGYRPNQQGKMTYYKDLDETLNKKKEPKIFKKLDNILMKGKPIKNINYKNNVVNKKGQKLKIIRPPIIQP